MVQVGFLIGNVITYPITPTISKKALEQTQNSLWLHTNKKQLMSRYRHYENINMSTFPYYKIELHEFTNLYDLTTE